MACYGYHPLQPVNVIAASSNIPTIHVPPQEDVVINSSLIISLVSPTTSAAVFTNFLAGCGLVGINSGQLGTPINGTGAGSNGTMLNVPQVVDRPRNHLLFRCTGSWTVGTTTRQTEYGKCKLLIPNICN